MTHRLMDRRFLDFILTDIFCGSSCPHPPLENGSVTIKRNPSELSGGESRNQAEPL